MIIRRTLPFILIVFSAFVPLTSSAGDLMQLFRGGERSEQFDDDGNTSSDGQIVNRPMSTGPIYEGANSPLFNEEKSTTVTMSADDSSSGTVTGNDSALCSSINFPCANGKQNCLKVLGHSADKEALRYAIAYLRDNTGRLADPSCKKAGPAGIKNTGSLMVNVVNRNPGTGYFINFCNSNQPVKKIKINIGTGSAANGFKDVEGKKTTLVGAFLTGGMRPFVPYRYTDRWRSYASKYGTPQRLQLYGVNSSNNDSSDSKPMHESPFNSSWGCPSCNGPDCRAIMKALNASGPSLVMNYGGPAYHRSTTNCNNGNGERPSGSSPLQNRVRTRKGTGSGSGTGGQL